MSDLAPDPQQIHDMHILELLHLIHDRLECISHQAQFSNNLHHRALGGPKILDPDISDGEVSHGTGDHPPPPPTGHFKTQLPL